MQHKHVYITLVTHLLVLFGFAGSLWIQVVSSVDFLSFFQSPLIFLKTFSTKREEKKKELHTSSFRLIQDILGCSKYLED